MFHPSRPRASRTRSIPALSLVLLPLVLLPLAACSGDTGLRTLVTDAGYGSKPLAAPDFVANSRPVGGQAYLPVGVSAPARPARAKSAEDQRALEAELEGARSRNEARGRAAAGAGRGAGAAD